MKKSFSKLVAIVLISATSLTFTGCFGSFQLTSGLHEWNSQVSSKKFLNELVFLGLIILPVYELAAIGDILIFNSIEFWGGSNPIAMNEGEVEQQSVQYAGKTYTVVKSLNNIEIVDFNSKESAYFRYFPEEETWYLMDGESKSKIIKNEKKMFKSLALAK